MKIGKNTSSLFLIVLSFVLLLMHLNNIRLYNTDLGFDGATHKEYYRWIESKHSLPLPHEGWEFNQPPLYYLLAASFDSIGITPQIINLILFFLIVYFVYRYSHSKIALFSLLALPMLNYFPPLITNELLGSFFIILCLLLILHNPEPIRLGLLLALGFYSKYTILTLVPLVPLAYFIQEKNNKVALKKTCLSWGLFLVLIAPILARNYFLYKNLFPLAPDFYNFESAKQSTNFNFFTNLSWIPKLDIFSANKYSFTGGLWSSFWLDGYQIITPVLSFSKKALGLWLLGFPLTVFSIFGIYKLFQRDRKRGVILIAYIFIAIVSLIKYYLDLPYDFILKAFYAFGLIVPYSFGLVEASKNKYLKTAIISLLFAQFIFLLSSFWIQPWWHNAN